MQVAFYAPLKPPGHPVPSGDRLMARLLIAALEHGGHQVRLASDLRSFQSSPDPDRFAATQLAAADEVDRLADDWFGAVPDIWLSYHPYYKAPDLIGPAVAERLGVPYVTVESSYSPRRDTAGWAGMQAHVRDGIRRAAVNICITERDREGLLQAVPEALTARLSPFIDTAGFAPSDSADPRRLIAVAMMRPGDKLESYAMLAQSLALLPDSLEWTLSIIGDGPARAEVTALFRPLPPDRLTWHGECSPAEVAALLARSGLLVWPGCGEAYGLAYLEAQASGLPVVAQHTAGVPEVVQQCRTGFLTPEGDVAAFAESIARLLSDDVLRRRMGTAARKFVVEDRSLDLAAGRLDAILRDAVRVAR